MSYHKGLKTYHYGFESELPDYTGIFKVGDRVAFNHSGSVCSGTIEEIKDLKWSLRNDSKHLKEQVKRSFYFSCIINIRNKEGSISKVQNLDSILKI